MLNDKKAKITGAYPACKGVLVGLLVVIPTVTAAIYCMALLRPYNPSSVSFTRILRFAAAFSGIPAIITTASVSRRICKDFGNGTTDGPQAIKAGIRAMIITHLGLAPIACLATATFPTTLLQWVLMVTLAMATGTFSGWTIGIVAISNFSNSFSIRQKAAAPQLLQQQEIVSDKQSPHCTSPSTTTENTLSHKAPSRTHPSIETKNQILSQTIKGQPL